MATINFTTTDTDFTLEVNGNTYGTWQKRDEVDRKYDIVVYDDRIVLSLDNPFRSYVIHEDDTVNVDGEEVTGTMQEIGAQLKDDVFYLTTGDSSTSYKVFTALLSQSGTDTPVAIEHQNTIGEITYQINSQQSKIIFPEPILKTKLFIPNCSITWNNTSVLTLLISDGSAIKGYVVISTNYEGDYVSGLQIDAYDDSWSSVSLDEVTDYLPIEIRVYP